MILFTVLTILAALIGVIALIALIGGGAAFIVVFGDLIVCVAIITLLIRWIIKRKKK